MDAAEVLDRFLNDCAYTAPEMLPMRIQQLIEMRAEMGEAIVARVNAYVVEASSGEYSDRQTWPAAVYLDLGAAREHADRAAAEARRRHPAEIYDDKGNFSEAFLALATPPNPLDALPLAEDAEERATFYREGIDYSVDTVPMLSEVPS